jgi:sugar/nucleoside kinase (ribokinase family)
VTVPPTPVSLRVKPGPSRLAVTGIGNAMLDIISRDSNEVYKSLGLVKSTMTLIERDQLDVFYRAMGETTEMSGGSVANSIAGIAALGGTCGYIGKVADDEFGQRFTDDLRSLGVELDLAIASQGEGVTGRCHVFITDDAQRTMATYLGASNQLRVADVKEDLIARSEITYVEGYLYDLAPAKQAIQKVVNFAHVHDSMVALSLSDMFCVDRHRRDFLELVTHDVDVLLANRDEILSLFQTDSLERAFANLEELGVLAVVTRGPLGADVATVSGVVNVPAHPVEDVIDQNGAGDMFASGFLYGLALGADPVEAAELGSLCAGEIIAHLGARPEGDLEELAIAAGLL